MSTVFVDTSAFYAFLDADDHFHAECVRLFANCEHRGLHLIASNYVVHETWALIQARLGWAAVDDWLEALLPRCEVIWISATLLDRAVARCRQARERRLSLTDCTSFEVMLEQNCRWALADDEHFRQQGFAPPEHPPCK